MTLTRVQFRDGQVLNAGDLNAASDHRRSLRRRHDLGAHGWGIVWGLELTAEAGGFVVAAGLAWDGYGRSLFLSNELFRAWRLPAPPGAEAETIFKRLGSQAVDVWLQYDLPDPAGTDHSPAADRRPETARLCYTLAAGRPAAREGFDPRHPPGVAGHFGPHAEPPDDPACLWPVYLGTLLDGFDTPQIDVSWRPFVGVTGQTIVSTSRRPSPEPAAAAAAPPPVARARLLLDGEVAAPRPRRFAVLLPDDDAQPVERLAVEPRRIILRGHATLISGQPVGIRPAASDLFLAGVEADIDAGDVRDPEAAACLLDELDDRGPSLARQIRALPPDESRRLVSARLKELLEQPELPEWAIFKQVRLRPITQTFLNLSRGSARVRLRSLGGATSPLEMQRNRLLLEDLLGKALAARPIRANTLGFTPPATPPAARPWSIYRADLPPDPATGTPPRRQLRVEFHEFAEPDHPERAQFAVGITRGGAFEPCLSIDEHCSLTIPGFLSIEGNLILRPAPSSLPSAPGAGGGALPSGQPSFEEAIASQPQAPSTLTVAIVGLNPRVNTPWPYTVRIANTGSESLRFVVVNENFVINRGVPSDTRIAGGVESLPAGGSADVPVTHPANLPNTATEVAVQLTVMAFTPDGRVMYQSAGDRVPV